MKNSLQRLKNNFMLIITDGGFFFFGSFVLLKIEISIQMFQIIILIIHKSI